MYEKSDPKVQEFAKLHDKLLEVERELLGQKIVFIHFTPTYDFGFSFGLETEYIKLTIGIDKCNHGDITCEIENKK